MDLLRAGVLWLLAFALLLGAAFCFFFGLRSLVEAVRGQHDGRTRLTGLLIAGAFGGVALLLGWGAVSLWQWR